jgi:hypothetical protein
MWETAMRDARRRRRVTRRPEELLPALLADAAARIIARGVETGEFLPGDVALRARFFASAYLSLLAPMQASLREDALIREMDEFTLRALGAGDSITATEAP